MGIKNLTKFIRDKFPEIISTVHISNFARQKIALDSQLFLYKLKCANPEKWKSNTVYFLLEFRKWNVHPIVVMEGKGPQAKSQTVLTRIETKQKSLRRKDILEELFCDSTSRNNQGLLDELKTLGQNINDLKGLTGEFDDDKLEAEMEKMEKRCMSVGDVDKNILRIICSCLGITYIDAPGESEEYCCSLQKAGKVHAVLSDDSDCMVYGPSVWLSKFDTKQGSTTVQMINIEELYSAIGLTKDEFIRFCCLCGSDYETNPPGMGPVKILAQYKKTHSFDGLWEEKYEVPYNIFTEERKKLERVRFCKNPTRKMLQYMTQRIPETGLVSIERMYSTSRTTPSIMDEVKKVVKDSLKDSEGVEETKVEETKVEQEEELQFKLPDNSWSEFFSQDKVQRMLKAIPKLDPETTAPPMKKVFRAFNMLAPEDIAVVIIGQDPYHTPGVADGLAFSSKKSVQPSLKNIYKELKDDGFEISDETSGDLTSWAEQGVFLINTALTVTHGQANSHKDYWADFTSYLLEYLNQREDPLVVILWGNQAQAHGKVFDSFKHKKITGTHPSPLGANKGGFFETKPFSRANNILVKSLGYKEGIDWSL